MVRKLSQVKNKGRSFRFELSRTGMFLWGSVFLFLLVWVFALGVLAGRGSLPGGLAVEELREQVAKIQDIVRREGPRQAEQEDDPPPESPKLTFYEKLATKKDETREREVSRSPASGGRPVRPAGTVVERVPPRVEARPQEKQTEPARVEVQEPDKQRVSSPEPSPPAAGAEVPPPVVRRGGLLVEARFTVQVAAVESRSAAEEMIERLKRNGHPAYYYDVKVGGKTYYRVRCGRFLSRTEAEEYAALLAKKEGVNGFVSMLE